MRISFAGTPEFSSCAVGDRTTPPPAGGTPPKEGNGVRGLFDSPPVEGCRVAAGWFRRTSEVKSQREQVNRTGINYLI